MADKQTLSVQVKSLHKRISKTDSRYGALDKRQARLVDSHMGLTQRVAEMEHEVQQILESLVSVRLKRPRE